MNLRDFVFMVIAAFLGCGLWSFYTNLLDLIYWRVIEARRAKQQERS